MSKMTKREGAFFEKTTETMKKIQGGVLKLKKMSVNQLKDYRIGLYSYYYPQQKAQIEDVTKHICRKLHVKYIPPVQEPKPSNSNIQTEEKKWGLSFLKSLPLLGRLFTQKVNSQPQKEFASGGYQLVKQQQQGYEKELVPRDRFAQLDKSESQNIHSKKKVD